MLSQEDKTRRKSVENAMAIMLSATNGPDEVFKKVYCLAINMIVKHI